MPNSKLTNEVGLVLEVSYPHGIDCVWVAADRAGQIGAFITAGMAPIPIKVLSSTSVSIEDVEQLIYQLPKMSKGRLLVEVKRPDSFLDLAERGVFVYDWTDSHRSNVRLIRAYELVAVPVVPKSVEHLPRELANLARTLTFDEVSFRDQSSLDVSKYCECIEGE
jgi:hypothetical protein